MSAVENPFAGLLNGIFSEFFGQGPIPPETVARRVLGLDATIPVTKSIVRSAFHRQVRSLRPDLTDAQADHLRLNRLGEKSTDRLAELLWARDDLLRRIPEPVTDGEKGSWGLPSSRNTVVVTPETWRVRAKVKSRNTYTVAERISAELRDRPEGYWRFTTRPGTQDEWEKIEGRHIKWESSRSASICGKCARDIAPTDSVERDSHDTRCMDCASQNFTVKDRPLTDCHGCGRTTRDARPRRFVSDWETGFSGKRTFCCERCSAMFYRRRTQQRRADDRAAAGPYRCEGCEEIMDGQRADAKFCSPACRQRAYRERQHA